MLLPNGRFEGKDYVVGSIEGEPGKSMKVAIEGTYLGTYTEFATGETNDLIDLWQKTKGITFIDALEEIKKYLNIQEKKIAYNVTAPKPVKLKHEPMKKDSICHGWLNNNRWISDETIKAFKIRVQGDVIIFPYMKGDKLLMYKTRDIGKEIQTGKKDTKSNANPYKMLFGWQAVPDGCREIVICEGEIDAMTWFEQGIPALSVPFGGGSGKKQDWVENEYEDLQRFDKIYLSMDMDEAGKEGLKEITNRLGKENCWVVELPAKDANECHKKSILLKDYLNKARTVDPEGLKNSSEFADKVWELFNPHLQKNNGWRLPWVAMGEKFRFREGELTVWQGYNDHGKSMLLGYVMNNIMLQGERICIASMEMVAQRTLKRMYSKIIGTPDSGVIEHFEKAKNFFATNCWIFDKTGNVEISQMLDIFKYARKRYGVKFFVVDSLLKCVRGEDDYNGQKNFVGDLCDFAIEHDCHVNLVAHTRKGKSSDNRDERD